MAEAAGAAPAAAAPNSFAAKHPKLDVVKTNAAYLAMGNKAGVAPKGVATRSFLSTLRYVIRYALRRAFRLAKYAAIGGVVAFLGAGVLGTVGSGIAFFAAPSMGVGMGMGVAWGLIKYTWRHRPDRFRGTWWDEMVDRAASGRSPEADERADAEVAQAARHEENRRVRQDVWARVDAV